MAHGEREVDHVERVEDHVELAEDHAGREEDHGVEEGRGVVPAPGAVRALDEAVAAVVHSSQRAVVHSFQKAVVAHRKQVEQEEEVDHKNLKGPKGVVDRTRWMDRESPRSV